MGYFMAFLHGALEIWLTPNEAQKESWPQPESLVLHAEAIIQLPNFRLYTCDFPLECAAGISLHSLAVQKEALRC